MINIKFNTNDLILKIVIYLLIAILIFQSSSRIVFSKELNENIKNLNSPEEELAIKYCDSIKKNIFNGLDKESLLKYEYYFSALKKPINMNPGIFIKKFEIKVEENCFYKLTEIDRKEFLEFEKKFFESIKD